MSTFANSTDLLIMLTLAALLAPLGLALLVVARHRRIGSHLFCRNCDYALQGLGNDTKRCPECGSDLGGSGAVALGRRQPDRALTTAGAALLLPALVIGGLFVTRALTRPPARVMLPSRAPVMIAPRTFAPAPLAAPTTARSKGP